MFLDKLIATTILCASMGLNLNDGSNSAPSTATKTFMNSTEYEMVLNNVVPLDPHSYVTLDEEVSVYTDMYVAVYNAESKPDDVYYWVNQVDNEEEVLIPSSSWQDVSGVFFYDLTDLSSDTINGIQFFQKKTLVGETYYITQPSLENVSFFDENLLPDGSTALLDLNNGSSVSITSLSLEKVAQPKGITPFIQLKINNLSYIANNSITGITPIDSSQCTNVIMYKSNYTNRLTFTNGYYPRAWNVQGYSDVIGRGILTEEYQPYISFTTASNTGISLEPLTTGVTLVGLSFEALNSLFGYLVFPGVTLGMLLLVPVILGLLFAIIKLVKKGG